jgi:hypothetical protein
MAGIEGKNMRTGPLAAMTRPPRGAAVILCAFCRKKPVKRRYGWPQTYCSNECRKKAHNRSIGVAILTAKAGDPCRDRDWRRR